MPTLPDVGDSQIVIYVAIGVVILFAIAQGTEKGLGPIGRGIYKMGADRREAAAAKDDSDIAQLKRQVSNLVETLETTRGQVNDLQRQNEAQTLVLIAHAAWDFAAQQAAIEAGLDLGQPPPLRPSITD